MRIVHGVRLRLWLRVCDSTLVSVLVEHVRPPARCRDSLGVDKQPVGDGAHEAAIEIEQAQPGDGVGVGVAASQHDHLVPIHCDAARQSPPRLDLDRGE